MKAMIINKQNERYGKIYSVIERNNKFCTIQDGDIKADYGYSEIAYVCNTCGTPDKTGLINGMCTDCYDMFLDIGKEGVEIEKKKRRDKKALEKRRDKSGYHRFYAINNN